MGTEARRKDPDQSQAGCKVGFYLVLVPINNLNAKLLRGLPLGSHVMSAREQAVRYSAITAVCVSMYCATAIAVTYKLLKPECMGTGLSNSQQTFPRG